MTGMRIGEATALTWKDVNLDRRYLTVKKSLYYKNAQTYELVSPKTRASIRTIYLDEDTVHYLRDWKKGKMMLEELNLFYLIIQFLLKNIQ